MVMKRNAMRKNLTRSIGRSLGRYLAIVAIIALGASMFVGLLMTKTDMVATGQKYMDEQNMFDLRLVSTYGWDPEDLDEVAKLDGIVDAEGLIYLDAIASLQGRDDAVYRFYAMPERINKVVLRGGRMPDAPDECVIDGYHATDDILGTTITIAENNEESTLDAFTERTYTVVGYVSTPLYMDMNRGTTSVGSGTLQTYLFLPRESFDVDYYAEINITLPGNYAVYTDRYNDAMDEAAERFEPLLQPMAQERFEKFKEDAIEAYDEGYAEYLDGKKEYEDARAEVEQELADALEALTKAEQQISASEAQLSSGAAQLRDAKEQLADAEKQVAEGRAEFDEQKGKLYAPIDQAMEGLASRKSGIEATLAEFQTQLDPVDAAISAINAEFGALEAELNELNGRIPTLYAQIADCEVRLRTARAALNAANLLPSLNKDLIARLNAEIQSLESQKATAQAEYDTATARRAEIEPLLEAPSAQRRELELERARIEALMLPYRTSLALVESSIDDLNAARALLDEQFASAEAELLAGEQQVREGKEQIAAMEQQLYSGYAQLEQGKIDLENGRNEYEEGKLKAEQEFADAEKELNDAKEKLEDAWTAIQDMKSPSLLLLDRSSNIGYGSLDSASDIVQGVSRVFPAFFLLVAALVCITTMTRMIDEERTQIGTLKALGYSNAAIISKYLLYAGSGAIVGCGLGVIVGSVAFPTILWQAYKIMLYITDGIVLKFNWWLCGIVVGAYTAVMLLVTWYCCRRALEEQPAELIRPKAPEVGKKILLERLKLWQKLSFLNKVTIRNIFRYRQRLAMMMVGIGGCTALLLTGFGLRDSIVNVVNYQFEDVTTYDLQVYFNDDQTGRDQFEFEKELRGKAENILFYHQQSVEIEHGNQTKEIYMMVADADIQEFIDFHSGDKPLSMPARNEMMLSVGTASALGIDIGDVLTLRNADMDTLELTVSAIYDNHVYNYCIVLPETIEAQWGEPPEQQMALVQAAEDQDIHALSADIAGLMSVMNVSVSADLADMVSNMMEALDLVVWVIVFCAGLLAAIVLYNLTNINITERIREIATIKVLGFNASETAAYVFKENLSLSAIGSLFGLGLGYLLLLFVMSQIKIDMVWFKAMALPLSYVLSIVLTMVAACIVDFIFYFKLEKINMAEALKSVE